MRIPDIELTVALVGVGLILAVVVGIAFAVASLNRREARREAAEEEHRAQLDAMATRLDEVVAERSRLEEEANRVQVLEEVDEQRTALLRSVSHDLRTPLAAIRAAASELRDGPDYEKAARDEMLDLICEESDRLDRLVGNLLSMSRIETGSLEPARQVVDFDELVRDRIRRFRPMFEHVRVEIDVPHDLPLVDGDYNQLDQVVSNLLENAVRYAPLRSTLWVCCRRKGGDVELRVADEGIGVADYERARIFKPFQRGEGSTSSGLGLAICKGIVEAHRGTIDVERTPGGGATFVVTLPARTDDDRGTHRG